MILGIKTKKDKEIEENKKLINTLVVTNKENRELIQRLQNNAKIDSRTIHILRKESNDKSKEIDKLTEQLTDTEKRRQTNAAKCGGLTKENNKLKFENEDLKKLLKKKEQDYYFALRVLFREVKMTQDTRVFLKQKLIDLKKKGYDKDAVSIPK